MEDLYFDVYSDMVEYVLDKFQVEVPNYKIMFLTDREFDVFNYECDIVRSFYYVITQEKQFGFNKYKNMYLDMVTKEYGEFFYQSEEDILASLIHVNKVYNTLEPVHNALQILTENDATNKDVSFLHNLITTNIDQDYLILLRKTRHENLSNGLIDDNNIFFDVVHEALHIIEHENQHSKWKFWTKKRMNSDEMDSITKEIFSEWNIQL
ncbi:hypothetical protein Metbo_1810 [Methanobacterium lacus]|uniref:Uncharacterized protein n=1 Tax=Methanobacterium lacus (strain AL-21) TaxID=877455 RepID=F0TA82_METLA|nr:hypothetical protein [Methanobacterium lacus]ADZ10032.1 hypothetical protein Metbo_1810 [Methanobacterium lacus]